MKKKEMNKSTSNEPCYAQACTLTQADLLTDPPVVVDRANEASNISTPKRTNRNLSFYSPLPSPHDNIESILKDEIAELKK